MNGIILNEQLYKKNSKVLAWGYKALFFVLTTFNSIGIYLYLKQPKTS
ncbi:hypothetical protein IGI47_002795 [Enterococcus sp. AZ191]